MNALFLEALTEKTHRGLEGRVKDGRSAGGRSYGYRVVHGGLDNKGKLIRRGLEIDDAEARIVRRIFDEYAKGGSPLHIAAALNADGVPGPRPRKAGGGSGHWKQNTINGNNQRGTGVSHATRKALIAEGRAHFVLDSEHLPATTQALDWRIPARAGCSTPDEEVILCAHIDGHAPAESAIDNASGLATILDIARELNAANPHGCAVRVLVFSAEEFGLTGSAVYVSRLPDEARRRIRAVLNLDCVAGSRTMGVMTSGFEVLRAAAEEASRATGVDIVLHDPLVRNSDHYNFAVEGIPATRIVAGFGEHDSKLRHVLTQGDTFALCAPEEIGAARDLASAMLGILAR